MPRGQNVPVAGTGIPAGGGVNVPLDEPAIPARLRRPLVAVWISLGLHAALIALVQVAPPATPGSGALVIEARLASAPAPASPPAQTPPAEAAAPVAPTRLTPSPAVEALPVHLPEPVPALRAESAPPAAAASTPALPAAALSPRAPAPAAPVPAAPVTLTSAVDLSYYGARDVDVHPRALREIVPEYPVDADRQRLSGRVRLQLKLEADGRVSDIEVVNAQPPGVFDESALKAFRDARFAPAQRSGRPVRALVLIEVVYDWEGRR